MAQLPLPVRTRTRRRPEDTVLHRVLAAGLETFLADLDTDPSRPALPAFVRNELRAFLRCGILQFGFARVHCTSCQQDALVAFSCKGRGVCPSCGARRMADTAAWLVDRVLPDVPVRQWVVTFPHHIRFLLALDPELCAAIRRSSIRAIDRFLVRRARERGVEHPRTGAIAFCQRFDQALRLNLHFHLLWPDGTFDCAPFDPACPRTPPAPTFHPDAPLEDHDLEPVLTSIRNRVTALLRKRGLGDDDAEVEADHCPLDGLAAAAVQGKLAFGPAAGAIAPRLGTTPDHHRPERTKKLCVEFDGFTLHAGVRIAACSRERLERLCRYAARPPVVDDKLSLTSDGRHVLCRFRRPFRDGSTHVVLACREFVGRLAALIPRPKKHLVTYHGVFAPASAYRDLVVPKPPADHLEPQASRRSCQRKSMDAPPHPAAVADTVPRRRRTFSWAELLRRVYRIEVLVCERCGGPRKVLAAILERDAIRYSSRTICMLLETPTAAPLRAPTSWLWIAMLLCGCAIEPEPGWQAKLERQIGCADPLPGRAPLATPAPDEDPAAGDGIVFAITLEDGARTRTWRLEVSVEEVAERRVLEFREVQAFELCVQPNEARRRQIESSNASFRQQRVNLADLAHATPVARIRVDALDADGARLATAESSAIVHHLRRGLLPACRAGHRQRELMRGRVEAGRAAPMLTVDDAAYEDIQAVGEGVASCKRFFRILQENPVTRQILREVLALPSLWSILTNWGVRVSFAVDFFAAEPVDPASFPGERRELWSVPMIVLLNEQPGFLARVIVGPAGSPDGTVAGIYGIVARHPVDEHRRVRVRLLSSRRGPRQPALEAEQARE